jgi:hypothetical protein
MSRFLNLWIEVFLRSFSHYFVLPVMLLLIVALLVAAPVLDFGTSFGIPDVINHDDVVKRFFVGCSLGAVWLTVLYCGYLLWLKDCRDQRVELPPLADNAGRAAPAAEAANPEPAPANRESEPGAAARLSFRKYAWAISWRFTVSLVGVVVFLLVLNWIVFRCAHILQSPPLDLAGEQAAEPVVDDGAPVYEESAPESPQWRRLSILWFAFLIPMAGLLLVWFAPEKAWLSTWRLPVGRWGGVLALAVLFGLLFAFTLINSGPRWPWSRPLTVAVVFLFWSLAHWRRVLPQQDLNLPQSPAPARWKTVAVVFGFGVYLFGIVYPSVTWLLSQDWVLGWTGAFCFLVLTQLLVQAFLPHLKVMQEALGLVQKDVRKDETGAHRQGWRLALLGSGFYILVCALPSTKSAGTFVSFFFFGLVIAYTLVSLYLHRAVFALVVLLVVLLIFSGVEAYPFRFPGLEARYNPKALQPLIACEQEHNHQKELDRQMKTFDSLSKKAATAYDKAEAAYLQMQPPDDPQVLARLQKLADALPGKSDRQTLLDEWNNLKEQEQQSALEEWIKSTERLQQFLDSVEPQPRDLLAEWQRLEENNHVIPARLPPGKLRTLLYRPQSMQTPGSSKPLIPTAKSLVPIEEMSLGDTYQPVVLVAVSGGGIRSAAWAFVVLKELELYLASKEINFPRQVRLITGASGGMLGASYYVELLTKDAPDREAMLYDRYRHHLTEDALTPIMQQMVLGDIPSFFSPWPSKYDRGRALEDAWLENLDHSLDRTFADFREDEKTGKRPFLVFTPMLVEDGRRVLISNLDLRPVLVNDGSLLVPQSADCGLRGTEVYSREALELFRLFPEVADRFKLSTAVRMSASFPFFSPAVSLPTTPRRRVVDAGYYDDYGVSLAASWLWSVRNAGTLATTTQRFLLVQIRDTQSDEERALTKVKNAPAISPGRALEEITSPVEGLYNSRDGSSSFRNDGQLELLSQFFDLKLGRPARETASFMVVTFELDSPAPLSWYLSNAERKRVWKAIGHRNHQRRLEAIVNWWKDGRNQQ